MKDDKHVVTRTIFSFSQFLVRTALLLAVFFIAFCFVINVATVPTSSMYPTLKIGSTCVYQYSTSDKLDYDDIVVFFSDHVPEAPIKSTVQRIRFQAQTGDDVLVKRIIGFGGDVIEIRDGFVFRNGEKLASEYLTVSTDGYMEPYTVPDQHIFVMGDNRNYSLDSRYFGPVHENAFFGKLFFVFPFSSR